MPDRDTDQFIEEIASELRRPVRFDAGFDARVMAALEPAAKPSPRRRDVRSWLLRPRAVFISPLAGLAAAAAITAIIIYGARQERRSTELAKHVPDEVTQPVHPVLDSRSTLMVPVPVQFVFYDTAGTATSVSLVGEFNDWDTERTHLERATTDGMWSITMFLLPGRHEYQFVVNGKQWVQDPAAALSAESDYGTRNSVVTVSVPER